MSTLESELRTYGPAVYADRMFSRRKRRYLLRTLGGILTVLFAVMVWFVVSGSAHLLSLDINILFTDARHITGAFLIFLGAFVVLLQFTFFYNTLYYRGIETVSNEDFNDEGGITQEVATVCMRSISDLTYGFLTSSYGEEIMIRSGIDAVSVEKFLNTERIRIHAQTLVLQPHTFLTLADLGMHIFREDASFREFLFAHAVNEELFRGANEWVWRVRALYKKHQRWWSRDNLGRVKGIGREFSYGTAFTLKKYARDIRTSSSFSVFIRDTAYVDEVITKVETILTRSSAANVMLVGEAGVGKMDILIELDRRVREGESLSSLQAKRFVVFDADIFVAAHNTKEAFEGAFLELMMEIEHAGNIVVIIENFNTFIASVAGLGVDVGQLLDQFLISAHVQLVATIDPHSYHQSLETNQQLLQHFSAVIIDVPGRMSSVHVLEEASWVHEHEHNVYFTYPAIVRIAESADQYIVDGVMPQKAIQLLAEIAAVAGYEKRLVIDTAFVDTCVRNKTGIPVGPLGEEERSTLMHLEDILHERVVGQQQAIEAIARAMRRARAGIQSHEKPIGTFLFLGSTGVGKTETAKALAHTFFGSEEHIVRFDMSEYSDDAGFARLLGTTTSPGTLATALREHPYCVLLLDEFEKASVLVHDLFLQVLDEGMYTNARGIRINARNTIVIATSNAGSELIWKFIQEGKVLADMKSFIVDDIIGRRILKPELLNRFDEVVLFETLNAEVQRGIAEHMLAELHDRIKDRGFELVIDETLIELLMREGNDLQFGARPMRRVIQDRIEEGIALKIIEGGLKPGDTIHFSANDFK